MGRPKIYDRDALLRATSQLFWQRGLAETSLSDIEKATGVNKSSLYAEFKGKDDIFVASLTHYIQTNGVYEVLDRRPLGKVNVLEFLKIGKYCDGQRGCFAVNSMREAAILPAKAKNVIQAHLKKVKAKLIANIEASNFKGDPDSCADMILTFNSGLCLELNASKISPNQKIEAFAQLIKL